jgi:hypothetical protein
MKGQRDTTEDRVRMLWEVGRKKRTVALCASPIPPT